MKDRLTTSSYCFILAANFLLYFGFWLLIPVLPFYLSEFFQAGNSTIGIVLSCYTVAALCIRPFSGYLLDTFARKPLYLFAYFIFMMMFGGYLIAGSLTLFIMFRIIHGVSFGMVTVGGNTVVIDIMPSSRRGEGLGYYGLTNNTAMSIGPMFGLFLHDAGVSFATIFCYAFGACILGFLSASLVKTPYKPPVKREPISLDRFILLKGMPAGLSLLLLSIPYGMTTNYVAMYARQIGLHTQTGFFFTFMAVGMAKMLVNEFNSQVPDNMEDLIKLPGVGRKTANVIQSVVFHKAAMAVDTHVFRVSHRIGLVPDSCTTPFSVEKELMKNIPEKLVPIAHHWLILHGRYVCQARTPKCDTCGLQMMCKYFCNTYKVTKEAPKAKNK